MSTDVYAGLDLATHYSGWTVGDGESLPAVGHWTWKPVGHRLGEIVDLADRSFNRLLRERPFTHLCYEGPLLMHRGRKGAPPADPWFLRKINAITGHIEWLCMRHGIWCKEVSVPEVKAALAGFSGASKDDQIAAALKVGLTLCAGEASKDEADSFGVWLALVRDRDRRLGERWDRVLHGRRGALL